MMSEAKKILLIGMCGTGKTWTMKRVIEMLKCKRTLKIGKICYHTNGEIIVIGKYDGSMYEGTDKLSMAVMQDIKPFLEYNKDKIIITEGDRFMNSTFIKEANPIIIKITNDGSLGRIKRNSSQSDRHLKSVNTRVSNIISNFEVDNSDQALELIMDLIK